MAKTKEELNALKEEFESLNKKLSELNEEELAQVSGGSMPHIPGLPIAQVKGNRGVEEYEIFLTGGSCPEEHNIMLTGDFTGNHADGSGGGVYNEGKF